MQNYCFFHKQRHDSIKNFRKSFVFQELFHTFAKKTLRTIMIKIAFDAKRYFHNNTGLGNYSRTIVKGIERWFPEDECMLYDEKSLTRTFRLGKKAVADGCTIFHGLSNELPTDCHLLPSVVTIHDVCWRTFPEMYHFFDRHIYDLKYGTSCKRADKVIAISESTKRDVMEIYGVKEERVEVIYQPVQEYYYTPLPSDDVNKMVKEALPYLPEEFILYVGSINKRKNLMSVVKALAMIPKEERPFLLVIGNGHEYRREVEDFISKNSDLQNSIAIETGIHNNQLLQALYTKAIAFVYPSFYEGFGLPVVEAALQKTPVITSTVSSLPEAAGPDACLIDPHAADAAEQIAHHIRNLCGDNTLASTIGEKMQRYALDNFTPEKLIRQVHALYQNMV